MRINQFINILKRTLVLFLILFLSGCFKTDDVKKEDEPIETPVVFRPQNVLFIGNSHTYFNQGIDYHLNHFTREADLDYTPTIEKVAFSGYTLEQHVTDKRTLDKIVERDWDVIVFQENSSRAAEEREEVLIAIQNVSLEEPHKETPFMIRDIQQTYEAAAPSVNGTIVPVGVAFETIRNDPSNAIELYNADGVHPSVEGSFLTAAMFYYAIYTNDPLVNSYTAGLEETIASYLKQESKNTFDVYQN